MKLTAIQWEKLTAMKAKILVSILSTGAIASSVLFTSVSTSAQPCSLSKYRNYTEQPNQGNWLQSPWVALLTVPGIALAVSLYVRGRSYQNQ